jgi:hypothetical protein
MRLTLTRAQVNVLMTQRLQALAGCEGATVRAGILVPDPNPERCNWLGFGCTPRPGAHAQRVWLMAGGVVSHTREFYNISEHA